MNTERVALVTGGGRGIGLACVRRLLADGFRVAAVEINQRAIETARGELADHGDQVRFLTASVVERQAMQNVVGELLAAWGRLDALINNAGINRSGGIMDQAETDWDAVINVNLKGPFICSSVAVAAMKAGAAGAIVNIGSIGAAGLGASPAYAASKSGLIGLTRQMARELGPFGITANVVAPGVTLTDWVERNLPPENVAAAVQNSPLRRVGTPEDIAGVVAFLVSSDARHVTGQVISASGGAWMP